MNYVIVLKNQQPVAILPMRMPGHDRLCHRATNESVYSQAPTASPTQPRAPLKRIY